MNVVCWYQLLSVVVSSRYHGLKNSKNSVAKALSIASFFSKPPSAFFQSIYRGGEPRTSPVLALHFRQTDEQHCIYSIYTQ